MTLFLVAVVVPGSSWALEDFVFDVEAFARKPLNLGGFAEMKWEHMDVRRDSVFSRLFFNDDPPTVFDQLTASLQLNGSYTRGIARFSWLLYGSVRENTLGWSDRADVYESNLTLSPSPELTASLGKKSYQWGKGYAWNPAGFINRGKDPNNPEEAREGYITADLEAIRSFSGDLRTVSLTAVVLPVCADVNEDFGDRDNVNLAARLYLLYRDTDIDGIVFSGNSRSTRFGGTFSRNIRSNFAIHGEIAHVPRLNKPTVDQNGGLSRATISATSYLLGVRYLSSFDLTTILEYYHNGAGYSPAEMERFYHLIDNRGVQLSDTGATDLQRDLRQMAAADFTRPNAGQDYLYARLSQKEPLAILYSNAALIAIVNLGDGSYSLTPELTYSGITNWELQMRFSVLNGGALSEYGEKQNRNKLEFRLRYFF
ncbi:hypothetical protein JWG43_12645 [Desulfobulbus alkaliphilus]|nr:hypothetical protein [Desulfobulbus alkaliphilus]